MKRHGNLYEKFCSVDNLYLADKMASKGKSDQPGVIEHRKNQDENILLLHEILVKGLYRTSPYETFTIWEPKERLIFKLPYFPDRVVQHAAMQIIEPIYRPVFTRDTFSCIKGRGIHAAFRGIRAALKDRANTQYCLKLDVTKFYPSVDHEILKVLLRRKIKDVCFLGLLDEIIDSSKGLPIGNFLSQQFATIYLTGFDHWIKEQKKAKYYFRYCDDMIILSESKEYLHKLLEEIKLYLSTKLKLSVKSNYQIFPVVARGIDMLGYVFWPFHTLLRKTIKKRFARLVAKRPKMPSIAAYWGWCKWGNCNHLLQTLLSEKFQRVQHCNHHKIIRRRQD